MVDTSALKQFLDKSASVRTAVRRSAVPPGAGQLGRPQDRRLLLGVLVISLAASSVVVAFGVWQRPGGLSRAEPPSPRQAEAEQRASVLAATRRRVSAADANREAQLAEGRAVAARIGELTAMRAEYEDTLRTLRKQAKASAAASRRWSRLWSDRRAAYAQRLSAVRAHNARERQRYEAGMVETADASGRMVVKYTYSPRYLANPARPRRPSPLRASLADERRRLSELRARVVGMQSTIASETQGARSFQEVYGTAADACSALDGAVADSLRMTRKAVVTKGAKGKVIDASKIPDVDDQVLGAAFDELDRVFTAALRSAGLTPGQLAEQEAK